MLRQHYGQPNFWEVPDEDKGDLGIEFYAVDGTLFQCYYPNKHTDMDGYKKKIQKKIRVDLTKLTLYESQIAEILDGIKIRQWVLLIPEFKSKDLIKYCNRKKRDVVSKNISFIDPDRFEVKIETADSYPDAKVYAMTFSGKQIDIPIADISEIEKENWIESENNSEFLQNIRRKSDVLMSANPDEFKARVVTKYIQNEKFLDQLRDEHPDVFDVVEDSARARLDKMQDDAIFANSIDSNFIASILDGNEKSFQKCSTFMSERNRQSLSFGYLSKWLAECFMDFKK